MEKKEYKRLNIEVISFQTIDTMIVSDEGVHSFSFKDDSFEYEFES